MPSSLLGRNQELGDRLQYISFMQYRWALFRAKPSPPIAKPANQTNQISTNPIKFNYLQFHHYRMPIARISGLRSSAFPGPPTYESPPANRHQAPTPSKSPNHAAKQTQSTPPEPVHPKPNRNPPRQGLSPIFAAPLNPRRTNAQPGENGPTVPRDENRRIAEPNKPNRPHSRAKSGQPQFR